MPGLQKQITRKARAAGKPVVVATQMLESMISSPVPTRAEVSDVATAVFDGADAVMLSAESAIGQFPLEAIQMMDRIAIEVEADPSYDAICTRRRTTPQPTGADAIAAAAHAIADTVKLAAIVCYTATGSTALRVARERPGLPIIGLTPVEATARRLSLVWGVQSVLTGDPQNLTDMVRKACRIAFDEGFVKAARRHPHHGRRPARLARRDQHDPHRVRGRERRPDGRAALRLSLTAERGRGRPDPKCLGPRPRPKARSPPPLPHPRRG